MKKLIYGITAAVFLLGACDSHTKKPVENNQIAVKKDETNNLEFTAGIQNDFHITIVNQGKFSNEEIKHIRNIYSEGIQKLEKELEGKSLVKELLITLSKNNKFTDEDYVSVPGNIQLFDIDKLQIPYYYTLVKAMYSHDAYSRSEEFITRGLAVYLEDKFGEDFDYKPNALTKLYDQYQITFPISDLLSSEKYMRIAGRLLTGDEDEDWFLSWTNRIVNTEEYSFCAYLIDTYGLRNYLAINKEQELNSAIETTYGKTIEELNKEWKDYLKNDTNDVLSEEEMNKEIESIQYYQELDKNLTLNDNL